MNNMISEDSQLLDTSNRQNLNYMTLTYNNTITPKYPQSDQSQIWLVGFHRDTLTHSS